ncbi:MAG: protoporphyrinogen oxidase [Melioribacteraceae bacterium]|nr:protoporphyrinogen oxidase [Melioribacteraceae bacterium]
MNSKVIIIGAGISGLATAFWLKEKGVEVKVLESRSEPGGAMRTSFENNYLIDYGPNSGLETTPLIKKLVDKIGMSDQMIYANETSNKRYIYRNNKLHALPTSAHAFIKTKLFSLKGKLRVMKEPFVGRSDDGYYQSLGSFVERRLGKEFLDFAIDPFVSGVFAGDPMKLSVKSAFPKLYALEENYGGLVKGMIKGAKERKKRAEESKQSARMFSFKNGMQSFPNAIAQMIGDDLIYNTEIKQIKRVANKFSVTFATNGIEKNLETDTVFSTVPSYKAANLFGYLDEELEQKLNSIIYPPVMLLYLGYDKSQISQPLDGFGFLIPSKEKRNFLGAIWSSTIFENRSPEGKASFSLFIGGARRMELNSSENKQTIENAIRDFSEIMGITGEPEFLKYKFWQNAIPQYNVGYVEYENYFEKFENENPGIFLGGNYRGGISVGDCVKNSEINSDKILKYLNRS